MRSVKADGVHLTEGQRSLQKARLLLGKDQLIGVHCGSSKHSGLVAAEQGANYVSFNADYKTIQTNEELVELFIWWSEAIEIPVMGECSDDCLISKKIWKYCDFFSIGENIWITDNSIASYFDYYDL